MVFLTTPTTTMTTKTFSIYCIIIQNKTRCTSYLLRCATLHKNGASICSVFVFTLRLFFFFFNLTLFLFLWVSLSRQVHICLSLCLVDGSLVSVSITSSGQTNVYSGKKDTDLHNLSPQQDNTCLLKHKHYNLRISLS